MAVRVEVRDGAEVRVETGICRVVGIEHKAGQRNAKVTLEAQQLRDPIHAWADGSNPTLVESVRAAHASQQPTPYLIEVKRKSNVDRSIPIANVGSREKVRDLVGLGEGAAGGSPWTADQPSAPAPAAQPAATPPAAAPPSPPPPTPPADAAAAATAPPPVDLMERPASPSADELATMSVEDRERLIWSWLVWLYDRRDTVSAAVKKAAHLLVIDLGGTQSQLDDADHHDPRRLLAPPQISDDLKAALREVRQLTHSGVPASDPPRYAAARQRMLDLGATTEQIRWACDLPPAAPKPAGDPGAAALAGIRDPDRTGERAPAPLNGSTTGPRPQVASHSGLGHRGAPRGLVDPKPWDRTYPDGPLAGCLNPSSYELGEIMGLVKLAQRILIRRARAIADDTATPVEAPTVDQIGKLSQMLMLAADRVQIGVRGTASSVDRQSGLYRRCTSAVWEAIDWYPYPGPGATSEDLVGWHAAVVDHALTGIRVAYQLLGETL